MNGKINADLKSLEAIYNKNKPYLIQIVIILASIILFFQFVVPQFRTLLEVREEGIEASLKLATLKTNLDVLTKVNEEVLDSQLEVLSSALPLSKDFIGMLNSVYSTAQKTGVNLGSFSLKVGDLSGSEKINDFPTVKLSVPINSNIATINSFVETVNRAVPLSEVYLVKIGGVSSTVGLSFYYKPLGSSVYSEDALVSPVSQKAITLVKQLSEFENTSISMQPIPSATSSATQ